MLQAKSGVKQAVGQNRIKDGWAFQAGAVKNDYR
jgi:hypothetical protein